MNDQPNENRVLPAWSPPPIAAVDDEHRVEIDENEGEGDVVVVNPPIPAKLVSGTRLNFNALLSPTSKKAEAEAIRNSSSNLFVHPPSLPPPPSSSSNNEIQQSKVS